MKFWFTLIIVSLSTIHVHAARLLQINDRYAALEDAEQRFKEEADIAGRSRLCLRVSLITDEIDVSFRPNAGLWSSRWKKIGTGEVVPVKSLIHSAAIGAVVGAAGGAMFGSGVGMVLGGTGGAVGGSTLGPVGTLAGGTAGTYAGAKLGAKFGAIGGGILGFVAGPLIRSYYELEMFQICAPNAEDVRNFAEFVEAVLKATR